MSITSVALDGSEVSVDGAGLDLSRPATSTVRVLLGSSRARQEFTGGARIFAEGSSAVLWEST